MSTPYDNPTFEVVTVTPEMARTMLAAMTPRQRAVRRASVLRHKQDLRAGAFVLTPDPIVVSRSGAYLNGQHRLMAIAETGISAPMVIARGFDDAVYDVMDSGMRRALVDRITDDWMQTTAALAMVRMAYLGSHAAGQRAADSERVVIAAALAGEQWFRPIVVAFGNHKSVRHGWFLAALSRAYMNAVPLSTLQRFVSVYQDPMMSEGAHESAAVALRFYYSNNPSGGGSWVTRCEGFRRVMNAVAAFVRGESRALAKAPDDERYPLASVVQDEVTRARGLDTEDVA